MKATEKVAFFFCFLSETKRRGVHREDRGAERRGPGEGLLWWDRAHAGEQDEVGEGEEAEGPVAFTWCRREENRWTVTLSSLSVSCQRLAEAAEDADLYHEYNATLEVSALPPVTLVVLGVAAFLAQSPSCSSQSNLRVDLGQLSNST